METVDRLENGFDIVRTRQWMEDHLYLVPILCVLYLLIVFGARRWMQNKQPFILKRELPMWNAGLAVFSVIGFIKINHPVFRKILIEEGFVTSICTSVYHINSVALWSFLFSFSKVVEFGDTAILVLKKSPLSFLHCYHHVTVCLYAWYGITTLNSVGIWFGAMNYGVHSVMYTYYLLKSLGVKVPSGVSKCITLLQLFQFLMGMVCIGVAGWHRWFGYDCGGTASSVVVIGVTLYASYIILFINFFYKRYVASQ